MLAEQIRGCRPRSADQQDHHRNPRRHDRPLQHTRQGRRCHPSELLSTSSVSRALDEQDIDLADVVAMSVASAGPRAIEHGLELIEELPQHLWIWADPSRIDQVLDNLISNAIKYTPRGGAVTVRGYPSGDQAVIEVADTGIGMDPADALRVFSKYFRSRKVRGSQIPGIGLGLGIVKTLVENHGGTVHLTTAPGEGSTFTVRIPLRSQTGRQHRERLDNAAGPES